MRQRRTMEPIDDPKTWAAGVLLLLLGIVGFGSKRQMRQWDEKQKAQDDAHSKLRDEHTKLVERTSHLEREVATRADLESLYARVNLLAEQSHNQFQTLSTHMNNQHLAILNAVSAAK